MKDYAKQITYDSLNSFVNYATEQGYDIEVIEGVLNDTCIIFNPSKDLSIKGVKAREYIILYPKYASAWHNTFHILMTDSEEKMQEFLQLEEI